MNFFKSFLSFSLIAAPFASIQAHDWSTARPDGHAPIGVMGDHTHGPGEWMASFRSMYMHMDGNRSGSDDLSTAEVNAGYMVAPLEMDMQMHMLGVMYAPIENLTLTAMVPYQIITMDHRMRNGMEFDTRTSGLGDLKTGGLYQLKQGEQHSFHANFALSLPTGSIDEKDATPMGARSNLPYPMQLGSGTFDLLPGLTYLGQTDHWSWGSQATVTIRLGENDRDYTLGNRFATTAWLARKLNSSISLSGRLNLETWGNIDGADPRINPMMVPTADASRRGGTRLDLLAGLNVYMPGGALKGHRIAIEGGVPIAQNLDGPQLKTQWSFTLGWQFAW
jgi:hypothetical protein